MCINMDLISSKSLQQFSIQTISTLRFFGTKSVLLVALDACCLQRNLNLYARFKTKYFTFAEV